MYTTKRRTFIKAASGAVALSLMGFSTDWGKRKSPLLSFSTLGCPDWNFRKIIDFAAEHQYNGIEFRGILRELDLTKCPEFSDANIAETIALMKERNLRFADLGSSCSLHHAKPDERKKNLDEGKRFIDLAKKINCPYVRVFPNNLPKDQDRNETIQLIISGLLELGKYASGSNVSVLMESHGELVNVNELKHIMESAKHPNVGLVWDVVNMWFVNKVAPVVIYNSLKPFIRHTHIKDLNIVDNKEQYTFLGKGVTPIFDAIDLLYKDNFPGFYSFEWEKLWHPEIPEPEIALANYPSIMKTHFDQIS